MLTMKKPVSVDKKIFHAVAEVLGGILGDVQDPTRLIIVIMICDHDGSDDDFTIIMSCFCDTCVIIRRKPSRAWKYHCCISFHFENFQLSKYRNICYNRIQLLFYLSVYITVFPNVLFTFANPKFVASCFSFGPSPRLLYTATDNTLRKR